MRLPKRTDATASWPQSEWPLRHGAARRKGEEIGRQKKKPKKKKTGQINRKCDEKKKTRHFTFPTRSPASPVKCVTKSWTNVEPIAQRMLDGGAADSSSTSPSRRVCKHSARNLGASLKMRSGLCSRPRLVWSERPRDVLRSSPADDDD